ncbi:hypothetical protein V8C86DRAFT_3036276 [Haematococcus lacustris]
MFYILQTTIYQNFSPIGQDPCLMLKGNLGEPAGPDIEVPSPAFSTHSDSIPNVLLYASTTSTSSATSSNNPCSSAPASKDTHVKDITTSSSMAGGCKGNRFEYDGATAAWRLVVPHSKNSSKGVPGIVLPLTDTKEVKLLEAYECQARPVLLGQIGTHEHLVEAMYLNNKGQPYTIESLAMWWRRTYKSNQAPWPFVPFHELRNVFITDRLDNPDMPGPSIQAAAQAMLNSPAQWGASYDMNKRQRLGKEAQATMPLYRKAMLQASPKPLSNMAEGLAGVGQLGQAQQEGGVEEASFFTPCFSWVTVSSGRAFLFFCSWVGGVQAVPAATHVEDLVLGLLGWAIKGPQHQPLLLLLLLASSFWK